MGSTAAVSSLFSRHSVREGAELAFRRVAEQARHPGFFLDHRVPDTLDGRFELLCLHAFLYLHRLKSERPQSAALAQNFCDRLIADLDRALRDLGVGDLSLGRGVKRMAAAFNGRIRAYEDGLAEGDGTLRAALRRNLYGTVSVEAPALQAMADYMRRQAEHLRRQPSAELLAGHVDFADPAAVA